MAEDDRRRTLKADQQPSIVITPQRVSEIQIDITRLEDRVRGQAFDIVAFSENLVTDKSTDPADCSDQESQDQQYPAKLL